MRRVIVTPATDAACVERLHGLLGAHRADFDEWHLWLNTDDEAQRQALRRVAAASDGWVHAVDAGPGSGRYGVPRFYSLKAPSPTCASYTDASTTYARLDERLAWLCPGFVRALCEHQELNPAYFVVFANVVGDPYFHGPAPHASFAADVEGGRAGAWEVPPRALEDRPVVELRAAAWLGSSFEAFGGRVALDETAWLCRDYPFKLGKHTALCGHALCALVGEGEDDPYNQPATPPPPPEEPAAAAAVPEPPAAPRKRRYTRRTARVTVE